MADFDFRDLPNKRVMIRPRLFEIADNKEDVPRKKERLVKDVIDWLDSLDGDLASVRDSHQRMTVYSKSF